MKPNILTYLRKRFGKSQQQKDWDCHLAAIRERMINGIKHEISMDGWKLADGTYSKIHKVELSDKGVYTVTVKK